MPEFKTIAAVIAAGGIGERFGSDTPKQFLEIEGVPIVVRAIKPFLLQPGMKSIAVVVPVNWLNWMKDKVKEYDLGKMVKVIKGGSHRGESVYNGLKALKETDIVHIHDAARPFITRELLERVSQKAWEYGGAAVAVPVKDTVKKESDGVIVSTLNRDNLWRVQTPQTFRTKVIQKAYKVAVKLGFQGTDDCVLLERLTGIKVKLVPGSELNIKITTPEDYVLSKAIAKVLDES